MASKTTRVTAVIAAKVEGDKEIQQLAKQLDQLPDQQDVTVAADITGTKELAGLADDIDRLPSSTTTSVAARVTGEQELSGLATDIDALPGSASTTVSARVKGDKEVAGLATDIKGLPGTTATKVAADVTGQAEVSTLAADIRGLPTKTGTKVDTTVSGDEQVDSLVKQLAALPADKNININAKVSSTGGGVKKLKNDLDDVEESAHKAGESVSGFASESTGTLGSQFSGGIGTVADFGEQFRNLKGAFQEAGGGMKAFGKVFGGVAATIGAGVIFDIIAGDIEHANALMEETQGLLTSTTQLLIDNGNQWDNTAKKQVISATVGTETFQTLLKAGANVNDLLSATVDGSTDAWGRVWAEVGKGPHAFDAATIAALHAGGVFVDVGKNAGNVAAGVLAFEDAQGLLDPTPAEKTAAGWASLTEKVTGSIAGTGTAVQAMADAAAAAQAAQEQTDAVFTGIAANAQAAVDGVNGVAGALSDMAGDAAQAAIDNDGVSTALDGISEAASDAQRDLQFLGAEFDKLSGRDRTTEEAAADLASSVTGMADAFGDAQEAKELDKKALLDWNVAALNATKGGQEIYESLNQVRTGYDESVSAAFDATAATGDYAKANADARKAADQARKSFVGQHKAMGLTEKEAEQLADQLGILAGKDIPDKSFDVLAQDKKAKKALDDLNAKKLAAKVLKVNGDKGPAERTLALLRNAKLADKIQRIKGESTDAKTKIQQLIALGIPPKEAKIIAEASGLDAAKQEIQNVADAEYQATIQVVITGLSALNSQVQGFIDKIFGTSSMAPVPGAPASSAGLTTMAATSSVAAPSTHTATLRVGTAGGLTVNRITVNGAVDPASTARQIKQILTRADRRVGPVRASSGPTNLQAPV